MLPGRCGAEDGVFENGVPVLDEFLECPPEVSRICEFPSLPVPLWFIDMEHERLQLFKMLCLLDEEQAKSVPSIRVFVLQMLVHSCAKISRETYLIETLILVERIHTMFLGHEFCNLVVVPVKDITRNMFEMSRY